MPDGYHIMSDSEVGEYVDRLLSEKYPDLCRPPDQDPAQAQPPADSAEQIKKDFPWLYPDESENT